MSASRKAGPDSNLNTQFRGAALALTTLLKAAQTQSQDAYKQGYSHALADVLEALQSGLAVHEGGDASMGIPALIDWIEERQHGLSSNPDASDLEDSEEAHSRHQSAATGSAAETSQAPAASSAPQQQQTSPAAAPSPPSSRDSSPASPRQTSARFDPPVVTSLPSNADFTFSFPMPASRSVAQSGSAANGPSTTAAGKKAARHQARQAIRREGMNLDESDYAAEAVPGARKRKWWEDTLANGLVHLDLDSASQAQQHRQHQEDQALRLFGDISAEARPFKRLNRR